MRLLLAAPFALALTASASAQFDGPAPLAWRWVQPTSAAPTGAPLVNGETIYTAVGGRIYAIDRATGNKKWQYPQVEPVNGLFRTTPVIVGDTLVATADNKTVYAIDPDTGAPKWTYNSPSAVLGAPVAANTFVAFATSDNTLIALDAATGKPVWAPYNIYDRIQGQIAAYNGGIVYFSGLNELRSLDIVSKKPNYLRPIKFSQLSARAQPVLFGDTFYVASGPYVVAVNAATGTTKWQTNTNLRLDYAPAPSAEGVFVVSQDGEALVLEPLRGRPIDAMRKGPVKIGSFPSVRPSAIGTKFLIPTTNGAINLFDPTNGSLLWSYVVRPVGDVYENAGSSGNTPGRPGGIPGAPGGGAGSQGRKITSLAASGPAVLAGSTLLVPARDGSILAFDKDLGVDLTPPDVKQLWPTQGDVVSGQPPLELIFRLQDEAAGINETTVAVLIDDKPAAFNYTRDGLVRIPFSNLATATTTPTRGTDNEPKSNPTLQDGRHTVTVTVADWMGNISKTKYSVVIDNSLRPLPLPGTDTTGGTGRPGGGGAGGGGAGGDGR